MIKFLKNLFFGTYKKWSVYEKPTITRDWRNDVNVIKHQRYF